MALVEGIPGEFGPQPWGEAILRSCELLLLRITRRPANHEVRLPGLATTPRHVVEDRTGKALTWRRDGDDLLVRLPEGELPVVRVALQGKLRIVPPNTVTANADGVWDLALSSSTAHLVARRAAEVAVKLVGGVAATSAYRVTLANHSYVVPGSSLSTIGPYAVPAGRVVTLTVSPADAVARVLVAPVGTVLASVDSVGAGQINVTVTNFGRTAAAGEVFVPLPSGWAATPCRWSFENLAAGESVTTSVMLKKPSTAREHTLVVRLDAGRRSASIAHLVR